MTDVVEQLTRGKSALFTSQTFLFLSDRYCGYRRRHKFFSPQIKGYHSFNKTIDEEYGAVEEISCRVLTLKSIMAKLGHHHVDLLKLDIEGFEYEVIEEMIDSRTLPKILLVEFHRLTYGITIGKTKEAVAKFLGNGYQLFWMSDLGKEYGFLLNG